MANQDQQAPLLQLQDLTVEIIGGARRHAVHGVSFEVRANEVVCVVGESGSGKSITAHAVMGLLPVGQVRVTGGRILFQGQDVVRLSPDAHRRLRGTRMAMIFQEPMTALNPIMRVGAQVEEVLELHTRMSAGERRARVLELFRAVLLPNPEQLVRAYPFELSGGQRQRIMIAMALALEPDLLIADEPTTALDVTTQAQILHLIRDLQRRLGIGVLFITHDFGVVAELADRIVVMRHGDVVEQAAAQELLQSPQHPYTRSLLAAVPHLPAEKSPGQFGRVLLRAAALSKVYAGHGKRPVRALHEVTLTLHAGETVGIVGESGSGKSTLGRTVVGLHAPDAGSLRLNEGELLGLRAREARRHRKDIQMVFQDPYASLNPRHRVGDAIAQGPIAFGVPPADANRRARELLELVGLDAGAADRYPHQFSGGQRQRIGIARALALEPKLLVADEAVSALDVSIQAQILELLAQIRRRLELSMLFITHDLRVAAQICDRIAVMRHGEIVEIGHASDIFLRPEHPYTRQLIEAIPGKGWTKPVPQLPERLGGEHAGLLNADIR
ncbi:MAG: ABC transporter ATP-binding protein [Ramlibacter sp.]|nr:ABC transporter ATP-binding protein [Ramlibacter sp.]